MQTTKVGVRLATSIDAITGEDVSSVEITIMAPNVEVTAALDFNDTLRFADSLVKAVEQAVEQAKRKREEATDR